MACRTTKDLITAVDRSLQNPMNAQPRQEQPRVDLKCCHLTKRCRHPCASKEDASEWEVALSLFEERFSVETKGV